MKYNSILNIHIKITGIIMLLMIFSCKSKEPVFFTAASEEYSLKIEVVADSSKITMPFAMDFLPNGKMLVTNRKNGKIFQLDVQSREIIEIKNLPATLELGGAGMQDIIVHPDYNKNGWIYFSYVEMIK
ncbi:MAG: PQQ-dependent sugar dehydrogenase, partial [Chitinophagaceae bacterium]